jgi:hypothetical protein
LLSQKLDDSWMMAFDVGNDWSTLCATRVASHTLPKLKFGDFFLKSNF